MMSHLWRALLWAVVAQRLRDCLRICPRPAYNLSLIPHNPSGSAHADPPPFTSPRGLASRRKWRQGTSLYCALSFSLCSSLNSGDPSVSLTADSSPKRGAKALAQRGQRFAARVQHWHADRGNPFLQIKSTKRDGTETPQQKTHGKLCGFPWVHSFTLSRKTRPCRGIRRSRTAPPQCAAADCTSPRDPCARARRS